MQHARFLVEAGGVLFPDHGWSLDPLHWEHGVFPTRPPGKSLFLCILKRMNRACLDDKPNEELQRGTKAGKSKTSVAWGRSVWLKGLNWRRAGGK